MSDHTRQLLTTLFDVIQTQSDVRHPFWLFHGPKHSGKSTIIQHFVKQLLGDYYYSDFLYVKDFSGELGKHHTLRVEAKKNEMSEKLAKEYEYEDKGTREIKDWLARSPLGHVKVVLIENIERMNASSANALLKTIEEPGEGRLIIATTSLMTSLLDTITSRALLIPYRSCSQDVLIDYIKQLGIHQENAQTIATLTQGRVGFAHRLATMMQGETRSLLDFWKEYKKTLLDTPHVVAIAKLLERVHKAGMLSDFLQLLHYDVIEKHNWPLNESIVQTKKYLARNVSVDSVLVVLAQEIIACRKA